MEQILNNKIDIIQKDIKILLDDMNNYVKESKLEISTEGSYEEQIKSCETILNRMKEIVNQKVELNKRENYY